MKSRLLPVLVLLFGILALQIAPVLGQDAVAIPEILTLPDQIAGGRDVTITVSEMPAADQADRREQWLAQAQRFHDKYPNVTIEGTEAKYDPAAFTAMCAGGELPTLYLTWFTEPAKLIDQGCVADITAQLQSAGVTGVFNPEVLAIASQDDQIYGIPFNAYALGLAYNIKMLNDAGYDAPPTTWEELTTMATALTNRDENVAGFAFINDGTTASGWQFTELAYALGASPDDIIRTNDDGTYSAAYGEGIPVDAMTFIQKLRWTDDVLPGATLAWPSISEALVTGRVAMAIYAGDQFDFDYHQFPDADLTQFGFAPVPAGPNGQITLTGGNLWTVSNTATPDQLEAAVYYQLWRQFEPTEIQSTVEHATEAVGMPVLPMYVGEYQAQWEAFRAPYNVLPVENYTLFTDAVKNGDIHLQPEPITAVQEYYAEVATVVSEVLSDENVDVPSRLAASAEQFQSFVLDR